MWLVGTHEEYDMIKDFKNILVWYRLNQNCSTRKLTRTKLGICNIKLLKTSDEKKFRGESS